MPVGSISRDSSSAPPCVHRRVNSIGVHGTLTQRTSEFNCTHPVHFSGNPFCGSRVVRTVGKTVAGISWSFLESVTCPYSPWPAAATGTRRSRRTRGRIRWTARGFCRASIQVLSRLASYSNSVNWSQSSICLHSKRLPPCLATRAVPDCSIICIPALVRPHPYLATQGSIYVV